MHIYIHANVHNIRLRYRKNSVSVMCTRIHTFYFQKICLSNKCVLTYGNT